MRILCAIDSLQIGGAEKIFTDIAILLRKRGYDIGVLLLDGQDSILKNQLTEHAIPIYSLGIKNNIYNPFLIFKMMGIVRRYDIVHTHLFPMQYWAAIAVCFTKKRIKLVTTEHSTSNKRRRYLITRILDRFIYSLYDKIIAISDQAVCNMLQLYNRKEKVVCIYNGIDLYRFQSAKPLDLTPDFSENIVTVTMVANFRYPKDQDTLIKAVGLLPDNYHLILVGGGCRTTSSQDLSKKLNLQHRVHFLGIRDDVPAILQGSDIIVMSSYYEGLSLSSIEGMCVHKPFVASDVDGLHEVVKNAGILFKAGDHEALASIISDLSTNKALYEKTASKCLKRAEQYDISITVDKYESVYRELLEY